MRGPMGHSCRALRLVVPFDLGSPGSCVEYQLDRVLADRLLEFEKAGCCAPPVNADQMDSL